MTSTAPQRTRLIQSIFPAGIPSLWCPPLTHYDEQGAIDEQRMAAHLRHLAPHARGMLVPGSTGDGWDLTRTQRRRVLEILLKQAAELQLYILVGALQERPTDAIALIREDLEWLGSQTGEADSQRAMARTRIAGFTVCPPRGRARSAAEIRDGLGAVLELGLPTALYQLPQMTENEMSPEVAAELAGRFANFIFFKDSSGADRVALSGNDLGGVFMTRGGEGDYERWLKTAGGPYDGFLLGSANCFAPEHAQVIRNLAAGNHEAAQQLAGCVTAVVREVAQLVRSAQGANAFAQANKAIDHFFAHGPNPASLPAPRLYNGALIPADIIAATGAALLRHGLMPERGYLE